MSLGISLPSYSSHIQSSTKRSPWGARPLCKCDFRVHLSYCAVGSKKHILVATVITYDPPTSLQLGVWVLGGEGAMDKNPITLLAINLNQQYVMLTGRQDLPLPVPSHGHQRICGTSNAMAFCRSVTEPGRSSNTN